MYYNAALVLEGGAMRGLYTSGILDVLLKKDIQFKTVIGVSAGSLSGANYVSKQYKRTYNINTKYRDDKEYISMANVLKKESIINLDFLFADHGPTWHNFDAKAYERSETNFVVVATELTSGKAVTFNKPKPGKPFINALEASSSMPFISKPVQTAKGLCLDGGIADSIPYDLAQQAVFDKIVVVRTRMRDYRKKPTSFALQKLYHRHFKTYPNFVKAAIARPENYNKSVETLNQLEKDNKIFVLAPETPVKVGRLEHNVKKLDELYQVGTADMENNFDKMIAYLES
ncbi:patatin family protein [Ligilactobacillus murinus]|uniref:patatin-like phospholipase family protein n=1 Tax=Ligilactobacillus murinus TaxID=1622 RepID=UPI001071DE51|nr:patatin family protein [Ligilactobacillus murinus]MBF0758117.1 patatin family protein [Ligilactobacillus murinus]MBF0833499.1 patatin family protein [Ligilactobacillus murinus]TFU64591.1 patatin family protein [Ligilactobacillus murinus]